MKEFPALDKPARIMDTSIGVLRPFRPEDRFSVGTTYEIFRCEDAEGAFIQIAGPMTDKVQAEQCLGAFKNHPEFKLSRARIFMVECKRFPVMGNFNPKLILPPTR